MTTSDSEELLGRVDRYLDTAPRVASRVERVGPFALFIGTAGGWRYYARPEPGHGAEVTADAVRVVTTRQRELGQPQSLEWVRELAPDLGPAAQEAGLTVSYRPLLSLGSGAAEVAVPGIRVRVLEAGDPALGAALAAVEAGFRAPGTARGPDGAEQRDRLIDGLADKTKFTRAMIEAGHQIVLAAESGDGPVAAGTAVPRGEIAELVGIATLPSWRRRGVGALLSAALVTAARARGVTVSIVSAHDDEVARVYERVGFVRIGSVGEAVPAAGSRI